jgi:hypothetical protein
MIIICGTLSSAFSQKKIRGIPDFIVMQAGGSTGYLSTGFGYTAFKSKVRLSAHYGIVPEKTGRVINIAAVKFFYRPTTSTVWNRVRLNPFDIGLIGSYNVGNARNISSLEENHLINYDWWQPTWRLDMAMESSLTYEFPKNCFFHSITGLVEFTTNEIYLIHTLRNGNPLRFQDAIIFGLGTRIKF